MWAAPLSNRMTARMRDMAEATRERQENANNLNFTVYRVAATLKRI